MRIYNMSEAISAINSDLRFSVDEGIENYLLLLNTHHAYNNFRIARSYMAQRFYVDAHALADTLLDYSELGSQYIEMVHKHITNIERILNDIR